MKKKKRLEEEKEEENEQKINKYIYKKTGNKNRRYHFAHCQCFAHPTRLIIQI